MNPRSDFPDDLESAILELKRERRALLLARYYEESEVQDIGDVVGDSLALARAAQGAVTARKWPMVLHVDRPIDE